MSIESSKFVHVDNIDLLNNTIGYFIPATITADSGTYNFNGFDTSSMIEFTNKSGDVYTLYSYTDTDIDEEFVVDENGDEFVLTNDLLISYHEVSNILIKGHEWYIDLELSEDGNSISFNYLMLFVSDNNTSSLDVDSVIGYSIDEDGFKQNSNISFSDTIFNYGDSLPYLFLKLDGTYTTDQNYKFEFTVARSETESTVTDSEGEPIALTYISDLKEDSIKEFTELFTYNALNDIWNYINKLSVSNDGIFGSSVSSSSSGLNVYDDGTLTSGDSNPGSVSIKFEHNTYTEELVRFKYYGYDINSYSFVNNHIGISDDDTVSSNNRNALFISFDAITDNNPYFKISIKEGDLENIYLSAHTTYTSLNSSPTNIGLNLDGISSINFFDDTNVDVNALLNVDHYVADIYNEHIEFTFDSDVEVWLELDRLDVNTLYASNISFSTTTISTLDLSYGIINYLDILLGDGTGYDETHNDNSGGSLRFIIGDDPETDENIELSGSLENYDFYILDGDYLTLKFDTSTGTNAPTCIDLGYQSALNTDVLRARYLNLSTNNSDNGQELTLFSNNFYGNAITFNQDINITGDLDVTEILTVGSYIDSGSYIKADGSVLSGDIVSGAHILSTHYVPAATPTDVLYHKTYFDVYDTENYVYKTFGHYNNDDTTYTEDLSGFILQRNDYEVICTLDDSGQGLFTIDANRINLINSTQFSLISTDGSSNILSAASGNAITLWTDDYGQSVFGPDSFTFNSSAVSEAGADFYDTNLYLKQRTVTGSGTNSNIGNSGSLIFETDTGQVEMYVAGSTIYYSITSGGTETLYTLNVANLVTDGYMTEI